MKRKTEEKKTSKKKQKVAAKSRLLKEIKLLVNELNDNTSILKDHTYFVDQKTKRLETLKKLKKYEEDGLFETLKLSEECSMTLIPVYEDDEVYITFSLKLVYGETTTKYSFHDDEDYTQNLLDQYSKFLLGKVKSVYTHSENVKMNFELENNILTMFHAHCGVSMETNYKL